MCNVYTFASFKVNIRLVWLLDGDELVRLKEIYANGIRKRCAEMRWDIGE